MSYSLSFAPSCGEPYLGPSLANSCPGPQFLIFMTIIDNFVRAKREVSMLCERVIPVDPPEFYYDFIVVGGGSGGAVVAARLSEISDWKVLLIEAGPDEPPGAKIPSMVGMFLGTEIDWQYKTINETNACLNHGGSCSWPRGKSLGGSSVHNGMMYIRGHAKDFDDWAAIGNTGWSWNEVLPHFLCSENNTETARVGKKHHQTGGPLTVERFPWQAPMTPDILYAASELGYSISEDLNGDRITGFTVAQAVTKNGVRVTSNSAFLQPVRDRENLHVVLNATATKILIEYNRVVGVQYYKNGEFRVARCSREVIVSGGTVGSPQLLLLSGIGPRAHLESVNVTVVKDLPGVGENLHNHVSFYVPFTIDEPNTYDLNWAAATEYFAFQKGPMSSTGLSQITGIIPSIYGSSEHPDLQFFFNGYQAACATTGGIGDLMDNGKRMISISPTHLHPRSRGSLKLASNNPLAYPLIYGNYLTNPIDIDILVEGIKIAIEIAKTKSMQKYNATLAHKPTPACAKLPYSSTEYWRCVVQQETAPENHQGGSCKMGPESDIWSVVDPKLRVYGIKGLRVADASIMPKITSGNTGAPAMMIGERAAAFIKEDWNAPPTSCSYDNAKYKKARGGSDDLLNWGIKYLDTNRDIW